MRDSLSATSARTCRIQNSLDWIRTARGKTGLARLTWRTCWTVSATRSTERHDMKVSDLIALLQHCEPDASIIPAYRDSNGDHLCMLFDAPTVTHESKQVYFLNVESSIIERLILKV